ncbi:MAG: CCA tRNA nucleotidyltransferase [Planctomycetes bacterium]|nr:CCA tRNA nucleotidyltransferase [Planctomycetota bacterium]
MTNHDAAIRIIKRLRAHEFDALLAGGCVRDMLLGVRAKDYDVATNAEPADVISLFPRTLRVGAQFGVIVVLLEGQQVEVATFRTDGDYHDGRRPSKIQFAGAEEDAARRDFTINGMFYDPRKKEVIDYVGGRRDIKRRVLRTIGRPAERFGEDFLRMLRAVRFSTRLGFRIEAQTRQAMCASAHQIVRISGERVCLELEGIFTHPRRGEGVRLLVETGLTPALFPDMLPEQHQAAVAVLSRLRKNVDFALTLASFCVGCETAEALDGLQFLKLSRKQVKQIKFLLRHRGRLLCDDMSLADLKLMTGEPYFWDLYEFQRATQRANGRSIHALVTLRQRIRALGETDLRPDPLLNGHDLIRLGAVPGPMVGQLGQEMYLAQLEGTLTTVAEAEAWVRRWLSQRKRDPLRWKTR